MVTNRYIFDFASFVIDAKISKLWWHKQLSHHDWEDIKQEILIHLFAKKHLYDPKRPFKGWANTVIGNQLKNKIRNRLGDLNRDKRNRMFKNNVRFPRRISTRIIQHFYTQLEEVVYEPDMVDPMSEKDLRVHEFVESLGEKRQKILEAIQRDRTIVQTAKSLKQRYAHVYSEVKTIRKKFRRYVEQPA